jgi:hypothetical protein
VNITMHPSGPERFHVPEARRAPKDWARVLCQRMQVQIVEACSSDVLSVEVS